MTNEKIHKPDDKSADQSALTGKQLDHLRGLAHRLKPVVTIGTAGLSASVIAETDSALRHHELIKVRLPAIDRKARRSLLDQLAQNTAAEVVQTIGRVGTLYRVADEPRITLPGRALQATRRS